MKLVSALFCTFLSLFTLTAQSRFAVCFDWGNEYFPENFSAVLQNPDVAPSDIVEGRYVRFAQFDHVLTSAEQARFQNADVQILGYVHFAAYLLSLPEKFDYNLLKNTGVRSIVPQKSHWKKARSLRELPYGAWAVHGDRIDVNLQVFPHIPIETAAAWCEKQGIDVLQKGKMNGYLQIRMLTKSLETLANQAFVRYLELAPPPGESEETKGRTLHRSNMIDSDHLLGRHYNGAGVKVLVRDDGNVGPHIDFKGRLENRTTGNLGDHGDWVSGCVGGAGNINPVTKGMASGAFLYATDYINTFQDDSLLQVLSEQIHITNSSYSDGCNIGYTLASQTVDQQMYQERRLFHVFSAGNSGASNCGYGAGTAWGNITGGHKMSKNSIAVASIGADGVLAPSSSRGPAYDGRIKPDISAVGVDVNMTQPDNTYSVSSGTSFAAPSVAGCIAQLTQAYKTLHSNYEPESALLKAVILNTANDLGNPGPDFRTGWGHINTWRAVRLLEKDQWKESLVEQGSLDIHTVQVPANTKQVRIMICWTDPAAEPDAARALVNDLDLRVKSPDGTITLPWILDPTPNTVTLNNPATHGRDSLNNMEQVTIDNPAPGNYTVYTEGTELGSAAQFYYLVWEFLNDSITLTYPNGGEGFVPGETERLHWDAYGNTDNFVLRYSTDSAQTWNTMTTLTGEKRMYNWVVPNKISGKVLVSISRNGLADTTDFPLNIAPVPQHIVVEKVCPDSMTVSWDALGDTLQYDVYLLGSRYMELKGSTPTNHYRFALQNGGSEQWISVRASRSDGLAGRRAVAVQWPGNLKNCTQPSDAGLRALLAPANGAVISCGSVEQTIGVQVKNEGLQAITAATIHYQVNNQTPVSENLPQIAAGDSLAFTFQTKAPVTINGTLNLKIWVNAQNDHATYNDTLFRAIPVIAEPLDTYFLQNFDTSSKLPNGWTVVNPDDNITWRLYKTTTMIGANGQNTRSLFLDCYDYNANGEEDYLYLVPLDLSVLNNPKLRFEVAYAQYNEGSTEQLRVEAFPDCDLTAAPLVLWQKSADTLATDVPTTSAFLPTSAGDWRTEVVDLQQFVGHSVILRFTGVNNFGNNMYIDNIGLQDLVLSAPDASFAASLDSVCRLDTVYFKALSVDTLNTIYEWSFGTQAQPTTAGGPGPHLVRYITPGNKTVRLIASNSFGVDTSTQSIFVINFPFANFTVATNGQTATLTNISTNSTDYLWDFGDGNTSTETNPVHTYAGPGTYTIKLQATNACKTVEKTLTITLTVGTKDLPGQETVRILPNPTSGDFEVEIVQQNAGGQAVLRLFDETGKLVKTVNAIVKQGLTRVAFKDLQLPKGVYQLNVMTAGWTKSFNVIIR